MPPARAHQPPPPRNRKPVISYAPLADGPDALGDPRMVRPGGAEINPALRGTDGGANRFRLGPAAGVRATPGRPGMRTAPTTTATTTRMSRVAGRRPYLGLRLACVIEVRNGDAGQALVDRPFDSA